MQQIGKKFTAKVLSVKSNVVPVSVQQLALEGKEIVLICSIGQFPWCQCSQHDQFQAATQASLRNGVGQRCTQLISESWLQCTREAYSFMFVCFQVNEYSKKEGNPQIFYMSKKKCQGWAFSKQLSFPLLRNVLNPSPFFNPIEITQKFN